MSKELFPESDAKFAKAANSFVYHMRKDAARFHVSPEDARAMCDAVEAYELALRHHNDRYNRSMKTRIVKDRARREAEKLLRAAANLIRANRNIPDSAKELLKIKVRPERLRKRRCPQKRPLLEFEGVFGGNSSREGMHVIKFGDGQYDLTRPGRLPGAERLELFVDLIPPGDPIPTWPGERTGGRLWSLGVFTRSPLKVRYPKCDQPMVVVYWARWGAGNNDFGPFSRTLVTRIEGRDLMLPQPASSGPGRQHTVIITSGVRQLPDLVNASAMIQPAARALPDEENAEAA